MAITLTPETEALLCERAARDNQDVNILASNLLANALAEENEEEKAKEKAFHEALLASGVVSHIPPPRDPSKAERPTFEVLGEPLSETIMRERR